MAFFGTLASAFEQLDPQRFAAALDYLEKAADPSTPEHRQLFACPLDQVEKIVLDDENFVLAQAYMTRSRDQGFFESHRKYIDVQCVLEGEEIMEVEPTQRLAVTQPYNDDKDVIKYADTSRASTLLLKKGDLAVFYPEDAHMPCLTAGENPCKVVKAVIKVAV